MGDDSWMYDDKPPVSPPKKGKKKKKGGMDTSSIEANKKYSNRRSEARTKAIAITAAERAAETIFPSMRSLGHTLPLIDITGKTRKRKPYTQNTRKKQKQKAP